ncbi:putative quinone oxidoreductase [Trypanosoma conorhini]|uniref:Putative quinone oxidoreductase n=1 Tax=Trypanosoma conorhini TaxID=83891 RepID=A0A422P6C3_9TRYP|nr:putative quinone oxidoreductase [Trypanosoma conorhini]RNF13268.1 putative quinone oxidoreductase [Trypanosoma conorhini]
MQVEVPNYGAAEVLRVASACNCEPDKAVLEDDEVLVHNTYAGVNFIDTYFRNGLYKKPHLPFVPGEEGAGTVVKKGAKVLSPDVGQRVAYYGSVTGSYATYTVVKAANTEVLPAGVADKTGAAVMCQGLTAHYLTHDSYPCGPQSRVLVHAAAGGTGLLVCQMAKLRGAFVVGVCGGSEKAELARSVGGADHVVDYLAFPDWTTEVRKLLPGGFDAVYDGVGKATFEGSLSVLRPRGYMISFGNASGAVEAVTPLRLKDAGSVYLQRPFLGDYIRDPEERKRRFLDLWNWLSSNRLQVKYSQEFPLAKAAEAHHYLESRMSTGKVLLSCSSTEGQSSPH